MVNFIFYTDQYHGTTIGADDWAQYQGRAADQLDRYKRIYAVTEPNQNAESMAICAMAEALFWFDAVANGEAGAIHSASIGSVSVGYNGGNTMDISPKAQSRELYRCACLYLDIYRG